LTGSFCDQEGEVENREGKGNRGADREAKGWGREPVTANGWIQSIKM